MLALYRDQIHRHYSDFVHEPDVALDLLKRHPRIGRDSIDSRGIVLDTLAQKPYAFASGSRLGRLQRLIYNCWCQQSFTKLLVSTILYEHTQIYIVILQ